MTELSRWRLLYMDACAFQTLEKDWSRCIVSFDLTGRGISDPTENPENRSSLWALSSNTRYQEKVRADIEADQPRPDDRLVIE